MNKALEEVIDAAHQEAWEVAKKIIREPGNGGFTLTEMKEIFGDGDSYLISDVYDFSYKEVAEKIKAWEEKKRKQIKIFDTVVRKGTPCFYDGDEFLVTKSIGVFIWGISKTGMTFALEKADKYVKTGTCPGGLKEFFDEGKCKN